MKLRAFILVAFLIIGSLALAEKPQPLSNADLAAITARGRLLYEYDQAAWHSTDAVMALHPPAGAVKRYVARKLDNGWTVAYGHFNDAGDTFLIVYEAVQGATPAEFHVKENNPPTPDTGYYFHAAKAIETALREFRGIQGRRYNVAALPAPSDQFYVYLLPAQTVAGVFPIGGDARYLVSPDGTGILETHQMHKSIIDSDVRQIPPGSTPEGSVHTHVLSDTPEDSDVFFVLARTPHLPEYVGTQHFIYEVKPDGTIRFVARMKK